MTEKSKKRKNLSDLKDLVNRLTDRDIQLKKDARLFEKFFENFPLPVSMWSSNASGSILSKKDKGFFCKDASTLTDLIKCPELSRQICDHQKTVLSGTPVRELVKKGESSFYVVIVPLRDDTENVIGTSGIAWDVSSNHFILNTLIEIESSTEGKSGILGEVNEKVKKAIKKSRLNFLKSKNQESVNE